jgi:hypothetical protein
MDFTKGFGQDSTTLLQFLDCGQGQGLLHIRLVQPPLLVNNSVNLTGANLSKQVFSSRVPCDHVPVRSWPLLKARQLMRDLIESLRGEKTS